MGLRFMKKGIEGIKVIGTFTNYCKGPIPLPKCWEDVVLMVIKWRRIKDRLIFIAI